MTGPDILSAKYAADPYPHYRQMLTSFPLYRHPETGFYLVSRHAEVTRVLQKAPFTNEIYTWQLEPVAGGQTIVQMDGEEHAYYRRLMSAPLRGSNFREWIVPEIERMSAGLIEAFRERGWADLRADYTDLLPCDVVSTLLGLPAEDRSTFRRWFININAFMSNFGKDPAVTAAGLAARTEMTEYLRPLVKDRRARPRDDLLSAFCHAEIDGIPLNEEQIQAHCSTLIAANGDGTSATIIYTLKELLLHPEHLQAALHDRSLIDRMHLEATRLNPPVHMLLRFAAQDVDLPGGHIPAGATVACVVAAAQRDPARFHEPDVFNPYRAEIDPVRDFTPGGSIVHFGKGRHYCLGAHIARITVSTAVTQLLDALADLRLAEGAVLDEKGIFTRNLTRLPIAFTPAPPDAGTAVRQRTASAGLA
ncbi:cytochrome P450 [Streptomyces sp. V3I8]|uniref:cytochrome P450 n=1 Tax=Streptomyces sp. V3I8 TaxID=3042279 RepID=UPI002789ECE7|nr:cytochrome P450 [Streptomyces sp. V3I8]MDQ1033933.1 cytochrome P450 [Streptomyces sp. V3I8]